MRLICKGVIIIAIIFLVCPPTEAEMDASTLVTGWQSFQRMKAGQASQADQQNASTYVGYISGIVDAAIYYRTYSSQFKVEEACNAVGKYLDQYPELRHGPAIYIVVEALSRDFPEFPTIKYR